MSSRNARDIDGDAASYFYMDIPGLLRACNLELIKAASLTLCCLSAGWVRIVVVSGSCLSRCLYILHFFSSFFYVAFRVTERQVGRSNVCMFAEKSRELC